VANPSSASRTILIVDDEVKIRQLLRYGLTAEGFAVMEAGDGEETLRLCKEHPGPIHLLLLDVVLPDMSGLELAPRVAEIRPDAQVIFMSGYADTQIRLHASLNPSTPFFHKPFTIEALVDKIRERLNLQAESSR
jgi:two-component system, cell cycle sensor histidine kinase and response regulator CckA